MNDGSLNRVGSGRVGSGRVGCSLFHEIASLENIFLAWREFRRGKSRSKDIRDFALGLEDHLFVLHEELLEGTWQPNPYIGFYIKDPKLRHIHKASVRDRVLHQAVFRVLNSLFEPYLIAHSYSSRFGKGTHAGVHALETFGRKASQNWSRKIYALSLDIRKFFDSIDHEVLLDLIKRRVDDEQTLNLIQRIVQSFEVSAGKEVPLGNVTSQLFANIYLNELDQFVKRKLRVTYYARYCDDFVIVSESRCYLESLIAPINAFLEEILHLELHPQKIEIRSFRQGIDFLGYVVRPHHRLFRTRTKRRLLKRMRRATDAVRNGSLAEDTLLAMAESYKGMLSHCRSRCITEDLKVLVEGFDGRNSP